MVPAAARRSAKGPAAVQSPARGVDGVTMRRCRPGRTRSLWYAPTLLADAVASVAFNETKRASKNEDDTGDTDEHPGLSLDLSHAPELQLERREQELAAACS